MGLWPTSETRSTPSINTSKCETIPNSVECFYDIFQKIDDKVLQTLVRPTNITVKNIVMMVTLVGEDKLVEEYKQFVKTLNKDVLLAFDKVILDKLNEEAQKFTLNDLIDLIKQCKNQKTTSQNVLVQNLWDKGGFGTVLYPSVGVNEHLGNQTGGKLKQRKVTKKAKPKSQKKK